MLYRANGLWMLVRLTFFHNEYRFYILIKAMITGEIVDPETDYIYEIRE